MFASILHSHLARYPEMQVQDIYKLAHQAAMGCEHMAHDPAFAYNWLERELAEMGEGPSEPVFEPISTDGEVVRVHLRPYLSSGGNINMLLDAFLRTGNHFHGETGLLEENWKSAVQICPFSTADMGQFIRKMRTNNYPAVHHSDEYKRAYKPAYRVICCKYITCQEIGD